ncbi:ABC transporter permease [Thermus albus]|uniref:ABC transporter permease n=1 Tax=Thermus albus TaxID=2908146 RepID=UPI001FAA9A6F|nr:ABC transporter permease subunit [Thermus albus]
MSCCVDRRKVVKGLSSLALLGSGMGQRGRKRIKLAFCSQLLCIIPYEVAARRGYFQEEGLEVELVYACGEPGGRYWLLREVYLPSVAAWVLSSLKVAVGFAFTGAVVGEFVAASRGLGYLLSFAQSTYNAKLSLALIALIVAFVLLLFSLFNRLETRLLRWRPETSLDTPG